MFYIFIIIIIRKALTFFILILFDLLPLFSFVFLLVVHFFFSLHFLNYKMKHLLSIACSNMFPIYVDIFPIHVDMFPIYVVGVFRQLTTLLFCVSSFGSNWEQILFEIERWKNAKPKFQVSKRNISSFKKKYVKFRNKYLKFRKKYLKLRKKYFKFRKKYFKL